MSKFKIGDRVKYVGGRSSDESLRYTCPHPSVECRIVGAGRGGWDWIIKSPALADGTGRGGGLALDECYADSCQLRPLKDQKADEFIQSIKKLAYTEPKVREYEIDGVKWTVTDPIDSGLR